MNTILFMLLEGSSTRERSPCENMNLDYPLLDKLENNGVPFINLVRLGICNSPQMSYEKHPLHNSAC